MSRERQQVEREALDKLVGAARTLDPYAVAELCEHFYPQVYRFMLNRVATREEAEDLTGEVCTRALESLPKQRGFFPAWLFRIARNLLIDLGRRRRVRGAFESEYDDEVAGSVHDPRSPGDELALHHELEAALTQLTPDQQEVIHLRFIEGYDTTEIAQIQEKSPGAVRAMQFRALETLRDLLTAPAGDET